MLSGAFSGFTKSLTSDSPRNGQPQTPHAIFLQSQLLPLVAKLQNEVRGRRYKDLQTSLQEAVLAVRNFQNEEWSHTSITKPQFVEDNVEAHDHSHETESTDAATKSTDASDAEMKRSPSDELQHNKDDVHPAMESLLNALMAVMNHEYKTAKMVEIALEIVTLVVSNRYVAGKAGGQDDMGAGQSEETPPSLLHLLLESLSKSSEINVESIQIALIRCLRIIMTSPKCEIHEGSMLLGMRTTFHIYLVSKSQTCSDAAKSALLDILRSVFGRMEAYDAVSKAVASKPAQVDDSTGESSSEVMSSSLSQYHTDSIVLFRSLIKLGSKDLPIDNADEPDRARIFNSNVPTDPFALNSKILSLELILAGLDFCGEAFCERDKFITLVQQQLCVALLKNCMSNHTQIAFLSQKIFLVLVYKFKGHLKQEIEVFLSNIFLKVLDSPNSSFKQKAIVLESLRSLCGDPTLLTQIFLNYDCDFDAMNLYKDIVHMLTKLGGRATSAPSTSMSKRDAEQDFEISLAGIEVLVTILKAFLRALGLQGSDDAADDSAGARIRGMLQLDVGLAVTLSTNDANDTNGSSANSLASDDVNVAVSENGATSEVAGKIVDAFEMKRNAEQNFEIGAVKFTLSLKSGLNFFIENGFVECDARDIARFFLANKDRLDKTQMGEALGREPDASFVKGGSTEPDKGGSGFWVRILHYYVNELDFSGLPFDDAIRLFLSGFRLPGEAQKIDRIMEKFAERFTSQNPSVFASADTAFILAFSVIMLNTDLHNPSIKEERRMTVESFINNNRGIGENGTDLPREFLEGIFYRIKERPFSLKEDDAARERVGAHRQIFDTSLFFEGSSIFGTSAEERKREKFRKEREEMVTVTEQLIRRKTDKGSKQSAPAPRRITDSISPVDVVKPMFDVTWGPILGILSQVLECSNDERSVAVCLNGFMYAVRIASHSSMSLARDTFVSSLAKFTYLGSIKEMKRKNVECIRTLLSIAVIDGEYLGESWGPVLRCISQLARLRLSASGLESDEAFLSEQDKPKKSNPTSQFDLFRQSTKGEVAKEMEESNGKAVLEAIQEVLIDKVFSSTVNLSANSLAHFIEQLIEVSASEISGQQKDGIAGSFSSSRHGHGPSIFSLQRLVEVADYNMDVRPRLVWAQVWEMMADYFAKIGCNENAMVSAFAIDSLKQLSFKFLDKPELSDFNFQRIFLGPFLNVMEDRTSREDIRELVLRCTDNIIRTKAHNLKSGWKVVFSILTRSSTDPSEKIEYLGLAILQRLLDEHLNDLCVTNLELVEDVEDMAPLDKKIRNSHVEDFVALCRASLSFIQKEEAESPRPLGLSMRAFCHTAIYADLLASGRIKPPASGVQSTDPLAPIYTYSGLSNTQALEMGLWRPLLEGLAEGVRSSARSSAGGVGCLIQRGSILALRAILLRHGELFTTEQLYAILEQTLIPAIQSGAENDFCPVVDITSESPSVSNIDFLVDSPPLPPPPDDIWLMRFEALNTTTKRSLGKAELMLEASFSDLRHGGDGDLRHAYILAKKAAALAPKPHDQPFPDSYIATTAPIALGLLTDICSELVLPRGIEGLRLIWPLIEKQYKLWCNGRYGEDVTDPWNPCEALVRLACRELDRFASRVGKQLPNLDSLVAKEWASAVLSLFANILFDNVSIEEQVRSDLLASKTKAYILKKRTNDVDDETLEDEDDEEERHYHVHTAYGDGILLEKRIRSFDDDDVDYEIHVVKLEFGAMLYCPASETKDVITEDRSAAIDEASASEDRTEKDIKGIPFEVDVPSAYWEELVPRLKVRCVAAHCLQLSLLTALEGLMDFVSENITSYVLDAISSSRTTAGASVKDEDIATAFQEALLSDWGDGVAEVDETLGTAARFSHVHGSSMFFMTQEASATRAFLYLLSKLYQRAGEASWNTELFAETHLLSLMKEILQKFLDSEERDGDLIDPNVWRNVTESGGKVALYCTAFAGVVLEILRIIGSLSESQFERHKNDFYPVLCSLIRVQSEEIRSLVQEVMVRRIGPMIGVSPPDSNENALS